MEQYSIENFKETKKVKKNIKVAAIILLICIAIICIALYLANNNFRRYIDVHLLRKEINEKNAIQLELDVESLSFISVFNNKIITVNNGALTFYSNKAKEEDKLDVILSEPVADSCEKYLALGDKNGNKIYLIHDKTIKWEKEVEGKVSSISVNKNGYVSAIITDTTYESVISVYDKDGNIVFTQYLSSTFAIDSDISKDNKYVVFAEIDYSGVSAKSKVKIISVDAAQKDKNNATVNTYDATPGDIATNVHFSDKDTATCLFDSYILNITPKNTEKIYEVNKNTLFMDTNLSNQYIKIEKESSEIFKSDYRLRICNIKNSKEKLYALEGNVKKLISSDKMISIISNTNVEFIDNNGWLKKRYVGTDEIKDVQLSNELAIIIYKDKIKIVTF